MPEYKPIHQFSSIRDSQLLVQEADELLTSLISHKSGIRIEDVKKVLLAESMLMENRNSFCLCSSPSTT